MAWIEKDTVTGGILRGLRHPSGKGERLIIFGAEGEMCVGFSTLPSSSILRKLRVTTMMK